MNTIRNMVVAIEDAESRRYMDVYSKLIKDRMMFIIGEIDDAMAADVIATLLYLNTVSNQPIEMYINSVGGSVSAGLAIYDTMRYISAPVKTICIGMASSMAAILLAAGSQRIALPNSEIMIHQPMGGTQGPASDVLIHAKHMSDIKARLNAIISQLTGQPLEKVAVDTDRDFFMTPEEAKAYGLIDVVVTSEKE